MRPEKREHFENGGLPVRGVEQLNVGDTNGRPTVKQARVAHRSALLARPALWTALTDAAEHHLDRRWALLNALKRYEIQLLLSVGHTHAEVAQFAGVGERSVRRIGREGPVMLSAAMVEEASRAVGRPSTVEPYRALVEQIVHAEPKLLSVEILRRAKLAGYRGGKSALYPSGAATRP